MPRAYTHTHTIAPTPIHFVYSFSFNLLSSLPCKLIHSLARLFIHIFFRSLSTLIRISILRIALRIKIETKTRSNNNNYNDDGSYWKFANIDNTCSRFWINTHRNAVYCWCCCSWCCYHEFLRIVYSSQWERENRFSTYRESTIFSTQFDSIRCMKAKLQFVQLTTFKI